MRLVTWRPADMQGAGRSTSTTPRLGILLDASPECQGGAVLPLDEICEGSGLGADRDCMRAIEAGDLAALLAADPDLAATRAALDVLGMDSTRKQARPRADVRLLPPLRRPGKIVCVGLNYRDHVEEQGIPTPDRPTLFAKFTNALVADGDPIILHDQTHALDLEAEFAFVVGRRARRVRAGEAHASVAGYCAANDVSARDLQGQKAALRPGEHGDGQWLRAKGSDTFLPLGPALVTADEIPWPPRLPVRSWLTQAGGPSEILVQMQDGNTANLVFDIPRLIEFISAVITLDPGDIVVTGTPSGVGVFRDPPVLLAPGDVVTVEVGGVGRLTNPIVAADGTAPAGSPARTLLDSPDR
jgi:2-keto-4-pentenoate hydratase/2-oxohepta-3-ene-1,7-dioic acid hydratase in catechol pathway